MNYKDNFKNIENIIFDFDGVIIDSMRIRSDGFREIFCNYSQQQVEELMEYHNANGGLSRFNKIQYFYHTFARIAWFFSICPPPPKRDKVDY